MADNSEEGCGVLIAGGIAIYVIYKVFEWLGDCFSGALHYFRTDPTGKTIANIYHIGEYVVVAVLLCCWLKYLWHHITRNGQYSLIVSPPSSLAQESAAMEKYVNVYFISFMVVAFLYYYLVR